LDQNLTLILYEKIMGFKTTIHYMQDEWKRQELYKQAVHNQNLKVEVDKLTPWQKSELSKVLNSKGGNQNSSK
jgi:hypothetical protein